MNLTKIIIIILTNMKIEAKLMEKKLMFVFVLIMIVSLYGTSHLVAASSTVLTDKATKITPNKVLFLEDKEGTIRFDEIISVYRDEFQPVTDGVPSFGYTSSVFWLAFTVENNASQGNWLLEVDSPPLDYITIYEMDENEQYIKTKMGDLYPFSERGFKTRGFVYNLHVKPEEKKTYYIRVKTEGSMKIPITIWNEHAFFSYNEGQTAVHSMYYGMILVMAIYNFFLFIFLRNTSYFYYSIFVLSYMFIPMTILGDAYQWLWPDQPWWNNRSIVFFMSLAILLSNAFIMAFLKTKEMLPRMHIILKLMMFIEAINIMILLLWSYPIALYSSFVIAVIHGPIVFFIGIASWRKRHFLAKYFLIAWSLFLLANLVTLLNDVGLVADSLLTKYTLLIGSATELVLFSLGLSAQVDRIRREKEQLNLELEDTQREIVFTMGEVIEARSKETSHHVKRVAEYSAIIAKAIGIPQQEVEKLRVASPMHDIGKVGIPDEILHKPGKLSIEEFEIIKSHTTIGYDLLKHSSRDILRLAAIIAQQHHEKFDGTGYPQGLKGEEIDLFARITAIADVFDALGSDRSYKKAWELDRILVLLDEEKGKHFDPVLVDAFFKNLNKILNVREQFPD